MGIERIGVAALLSEEQRLVHDAALRFLRERAPAAPDGSGGRTTLAEMARLGWLDVLGPPPDIATAAAIAETTGRVGALVPYVPALLAAVLLAAPEAAPMRREAVAGSRLIVAALEEGTIADGRIDGEGRLWARLRAVEETHVADVLLVPVANDARLAVLNLSAPGVHVTPASSASGTRRADVIVEGEPVPLLPLAAGAVERARAIGATLRAAELAGAGWAALDLTLAYVRQRVQFGRPIGSFQAVHHHAADMARDLAAVCLLVANAARRFATGEEAIVAAHMAKAKAAAAVPALLRLAHQLTGGIGFYEDYPLAGYYRRVLDLAASYGTAAAHRQALAALAPGSPAALRHGGGHPFPPVVAP